MGAHDYEDLRAHLGHNIACVGYGLPDGSADPVNIAIECEDCGVILMEYDQDDHAQDAPTVPPALQERLEAGATIIEAHRGGGFLAYDIDTIGCHSMTMLDDDGRELVKWTAAEWREEPEAVMAATIGCLLFGAVGVKARVPEELR